MKARTKKIPREPEELNAFLVKLLETITVYWEKVGNPVYKQTLDIDMTAFMNTWLSGQMLVIVVEEDNGDVEGFMFCVNSTPLFCRQKQFFVDCYYGKDEEVTKMLFGHFEKYIQVTGVDKVMLFHAVDDPRGLPEPLSKRLTLSHQTYDVEQ